MYVSYINYRERGLKNSNYFIKRSHDEKFSNAEKVSVFLIFFCSERKKFLNHYSNNEAFIPQPMQNLQTPLSSTEVLVRIVANISNQKHWLRHSLFLVYRQKKHVKKQERERRKDFHSRMTSNFENIVLEEGETFCILRFYYSKGHHHKWFDVSSSLVRQTLLEVLNFFQSV